MEVAVQHVNSTIVLWSSLNNRAIKAHFRESNSFLEKVWAKHVLRLFITVPSPGRVRITLVGDVIATPADLILVCFNKIVEQTDDLVDASVTEPSHKDFVIFTEICPDFSYDHGG
ncbi:hypothetical protein OGATHE_001734 [Ogataea polymorpha]|uniref:Uncharacterized protein n=1 Tax=Ogataea polymorpha TaxID=460523 RepID=A0A9P8TE29_9ASCO|nr:hypothetical protein OGATHE_001734 [Ogataea polymorpha]